MIFNFLLWTIKIENKKVCKYNLKLYAGKEKDGYRYLTIKNNKVKKEVQNIIRDYIKKHYLNMNNVSNKIEVIKWIREEFKTDWGTIGLKEAKELVESFM